MQAQQLSSWTAPLFAFCLSLLLSVTLAPTLGLVAYQQYDFWILWLITMLVLALPFTFLEIALAKRAKNTPLQAFLQLTRDADRSTNWRLISWAAVLFVPFIAGAMLNFAADQLQQSLALNFSSSLIMLVLAVVAFGVSMLPRVILLLVTAVATIAFAAISLTQAHTGTWGWTNIEFIEWAKVVTLTLVTGGLGLGLYWQNAIAQAKQKTTAVPVALPIWIGQAIGLAALIFVGEIETTVQAGLLLLATLALSGVLLQLVREQALERQLNLVMQAVILLVPILLWAIPMSAQVFYPLVILYGLLLCLAQSIFTGWLMKISHLRKSLNFSNELMYNLWRVFVRIIAPLSIVVALIGWASSLGGM